MGTVVFGGLGPGLGSTVNPFSADFQQQQKIATLTSEAATDNAKAAVAYAKKAQDWVTRNLHNRDLNLAIDTIEDPPLAIHIDQATGVQSAGPDYVGGLTKPSLPAPTGTLGSDGAIKSANPAPDRTDQILNGLGAMWAMLTTMQAELQAIKTKFGA